VDNSSNDHEIRKQQRRQDALLNEQQNMQAAELEQKRKSVFNERLNILNAQRGQTWTPPAIPTAPSNSKPNKPRMKTMGTLSSRLFERV
jgi:hypothetical protein